MRPSILSFLFAPLAAAQTQYLTSILATNPDLSSLADALRIPSPSWAGSLGTSSGPITIFAPTNTAFEALNASSAESQAVANRDRSAVQALLSYHVLQGTYVLANFTENPTIVKTISNQTYQIVRARSIGGNESAPGLSFNRSPLVVPVPQADIQTSGNVTIPNITLHKIDRILMLPANGTTTPSASGTATGNPAASTGGAGRIEAGLGVVMGVGLALVL